MGICTHTNEYLYSLNIDPCINMLRYNIFK